MKRKNGWLNGKVVRWLGGKIVRGLVKNFSYLSIHFGLYRYAKHYGQVAICLLLISIFQYLPDWSGQAGFHITCLYAQKGAKTSIETKIAIETNLENRLKKVLTEITGTEKIIVIVNVQLVSEKKKAKKKRDVEEIILPGVPIKETLAERKVESVMMAALGDDTRTLIKKLSVTIILDKGIGEDVIKIVKKVAAGLLGIDKERGDELIIQQIRFRKNIFYWSSLIYPPNIYWIFAVLAGIGFTLTISLFLFGPFQKFAKDLVSAALSSATTFKEKTSEAAEGLGAGTPIPELTQPEKPRKELTSTGKEPLFSFVGQGNLKEFIYLLKNESSKNIATAVNYLSPELSSQVINGIPRDKRKEVILSLSKTEELNSSEVEKLENHLKTRIDFLSGGEEKIIKIIDRADEKLQTEIINEIKNQNPQIAEKLQKSIIRIDILSTLDISGLQLIIRQVGTSVFGQVMKTLPGELQEKVLSTLPGGAAKRLKQEMDLGKPVTPQRIEIEKRRLLDIIRRLRDRGLI